MIKKQNLFLAKDLLRKLHNASEDGRLLNRIYCVILVLRGFSASEVGKLYSASARAVAYWVTQYQEKGLQGLEEEARSGRPAKLSPDQLRKVKVFVRSETKKHAKPVTAPLVSQYISDSFGITLTVRQCERIRNRFLK
jgi:transposase